MSNIRYKLTDANMQTHQGFQWELNKWKHATFYGDRPCSNQVLHHYSHPLLAVLFNPIHADFAEPRLFKIEIDTELGTDGLKGWCKSQRLISEIPLPVIPMDCRLAFAIYIAADYAATDWQQWASNWMAGIDRTANAAANAYNANAAAANAATNAANAAANAYANAANAYAAAAANAYAIHGSNKRTKDFLAIIQFVMKHYNQQNGSK